MIRRMLDGLYLAAGWAAGFFLLLVFLLMMGLSLGRIISVNIPAGDDFTAWSMAAMAFLGLAHTFKSGEMIRVGLLLEKVPPRARHTLEILSLLVVAGFVLFFARHAVQLAFDSWRFNDLAQGVVAMPLWIPQLGYAGGLVILGIAVMDELLNILRGNRPSYEKEPPATPEELVNRIADGSL